MFSPFISTVTPDGTVTGVFPILDIGDSRTLPDVT
jgi:hypothetical protein